MNTARELTLCDMLIQSGRVPAGQREYVQRLFAEHADDPNRLADELLAAKVVTKYQHRKIQIGRAGELVFGQYLILERIGEGGMGKVYRAAETRQNRVVALKTIRPNLLANRTVIQRYKREARAAASLEHPNIVRLFDADDVNGRYFLAMEFVDGSDLSRLVKDLNREKVSMPPGEAAEYIRQAALGLQHAHEKGLVHRDIKPSNLLVMGERAIPGTGGKARVKILDMGLVRSLTEDDFTNTELTRDGTVVGTPDYMSPEQSRNSSTVDPRADIYSLGCTLFYLLRGMPPYDSGTAIDKLIKHQLDPVPDIRQYRPDVPPRLAAVVKKMLAKKPEDRYQTAAEVAAELAHYTGDSAFDFNSLPPLPGMELADIPVIPSDTTAATPKSNLGFHAVDFGGTHTPAPIATPPAAPVQVPAAQPQAAETILRPVARPAVRPANPASPQGPVAGQRSVRVLSQPSKPITKRPTDATPSGDLEPPFRGRAANSSGVSSGRNRRPVEAKGKARAKPKRGFPVLPVVAAGVVGVALIVVLAVLMAVSGQNNKAPTSAARSPATATDRTPPQPTPNSSPYRPVVDLLPDDTAAVLVADPNVGWEQTLTRPEAAVNARRQYDTLARWFKFDLRKFDRVTVAFHPDMSRCVAAGEGDELNGEVFRKDLDKLILTDSETLPNGAVVVRNGREPKNNPVMIERRVRGVLLPDPPAYLISTHSGDLNSLAESAGTDRKPTGVPPEMLAAAEAATQTADTPLAFFTAAGGCRFPLSPNGPPEPLTASGVDLMTVSVAPAGNGSVRLTVVLTGPEAPKLRRFLEVDLTVALEAWIGRELSKPLAGPIIEVAQKAKPNDLPDGRKQLTAAFEWSWAAILPAVDKLLPQGR